MFRSLIAKIKGVLAKMGLIKNVKTVTQLPDIPVNDEFYQLIETVWLPLYQGYLERYNGEPFHKVKYVTLEGERNRRMNSLRMSKIVAEEMARLIYNERCEINISNPALSDHIKDIFKRNDFDQNFQDYLEYMFALGGLVLKVYAANDRTGVMRIRIGFVTADCFIPTAYDNADITEGIFVTTKQKGKKVYTLLEWHKWEGEEYIIANQLYMSEKQGELGVQVPLEMMYPGLEEETRIKGLSRPLFKYIKPNVANNFDLQSPLGIPIYANAIDTLKAIDIAYDSFIREFRLGKKRIIVPTTAVKSVVDPQSGLMHRYFDANDEVYQAFNFTDPESQKIVDNSIALRVDEHVAAINALLNLLSMQVGFSAGTFTFDGQGVKTATEVVSENSKTYRTKNSHETVVEQGIKDLITTIGEVAHLYDLFTPPPDYEIAVDFDDSIAEDRDSNADYYLKLMNSGLTPKVFTLMRVLDLTEKQAIEMVEKVNAEMLAATPAPDLDALFAGDGQPDPPTTPGSGEDDK